tara:strand:+ start:2045 stop:2257 length:213 start_codon:yes stop_codon:yes gene_type:complete
MTSTITNIIARSVSRNTVGFAAQHGVFFDSMTDVMETLHAAGHKTQQNYDDVVLVDHVAWVTQHGVVHPI